jgi:hypothetical protein
MAISAMVFARWGLGLIAALNDFVFSIRPSRLAPVYSHGADVAAGRYSMHAVAGFLVRSPNGGKSDEGMSILQ